MNYREKVTGCWLGKAVGGTLGQPYEGTRGVYQLDFYDPVPTDMIPNDDLDLQVVWACVLDRMSRPVVDRETLADAWLRHVEFPWDEYGIATRNLRRGIRPPACGSYDNWFANGLGAAIRSELWACLAPGNPELAARYAYEDACIDHAGAGLEAEMFLAAMESAAFIENNFDKILDAGLARITPDGRLAEAVNFTRRRCAETADWQSIRAEIIARYGHENFTDVVMNIPIVVMALLLGKGDFGSSICMAVNCGLDADCTGATVGALLGILNPAGIEEKWLKPIGRKLVLNTGIVGLNPPATLDEFIAMVSALKDRVSLRPPVSDHGQYQPLRVRAQGGLLRFWFKYSDADIPAHLPPLTDEWLFDGANGSIPAAKAPPDSFYMMRFEFRLEHRQNVRVMFNTAAECRIWVDGKVAFAREGGRCCPSFHRLPLNQYADLDLSAGKHELLVGLASNGTEENIAWTLGIGDALTKQWLPFALDEFANRSSEQSPRPVPFHAPATVLQPVS